MLERQFPPMMVAAVLQRVREGQRELMIGRPPSEPYQNKWTFPSGPVDRGESVEDALRRALHTLLDADVRIEYGQPPFDAEYDGLVCRWRYYFCDASEARMDNHYFSEVRWVFPGALCEYEFEPVAGQVVQWIIKEDTGL